jgi:hypothetical protein
MAIYNKLKVLTGATLSLVLSAIAVAPASAEYLSQRTEHTYSSAAIKLLALPKKVRSKACLDRWLKSN